MPLLYFPPGWTRVDRVRAHIYSFTVTNLTEGHKYFFRVIAENDIGRSAALESRSATETRSPFCKLSCFVIGVTWFANFNLLISIYPTKIGVFMW